MACSARRAWRGSCRRRTHRFCSRPSATAPLPSRNRSGAMPRKITGVAALPSVTMKRIVTPSGSCWIEPFSTIPPSAHASPSTRLARGNVGRRVEIGCAVPQAPHREQDRNQHAATAAPTSASRWFLGFICALSARPRLPPGASTQRPKQQRNGQRDRDAISGDDEGPGIHSRPILRIRASTLASASSARIRIRSRRRTGR